MSRSKLILLFLVMVILTLLCLSPGLVWIYNQEFTIAFWSGLYANLISGTYTGILTGLLVGIILWRLQVSFQNTILSRSYRRDLSHFETRLTNLLHRDGTWSIDDAPKSIHSHLIECAELIAEQPLSTWSTYLSDELKFINQLTGYLSFYDKFGSVASRLHNLIRRKIRSHHQANKIDLINDEISYKYIIGKINGMSDADILTVIGEEEASLTFTQDAFEHFNTDSITVEVVSAYISTKNSLYKQAQELRDVLIARRKQRRSSP